MFGDCCEGAVDPLTGECNKTFTSTDIFSGQGCENILDPRGACMPKGQELDQCGVPGGNSTTCQARCMLDVDINMDIDVDITVQGNVPPEIVSQLGELSANVAEKIGVSVSDVGAEIIAAATQGAGGRRLL